MRPAWTMRILAATLLGFGLAGGFVQSGRADEARFALTIKDHRFAPAAIEVPAGVEVTLTVTNADAAPEEFESEALDIEKIIPGKQQAEIRIGPLQAGTYEFVGEFHQDTAKGRIVAK